MRIVYLTYINNENYREPLAWLDKLYAFTGVPEELAKQHEVYCIEQIHYSGELERNGVHYFFRDYGPGINRFPRKLHKLVHSLQPDIVLVRGLHFPLQLIQLRRSLGGRIKIIAEHHADKPFSGWRRRVQRYADGKIDRYHFTALNQAKEWLEAGIISDPRKPAAVPSASTRFLPIDKREAKTELGWKEGLHFLWVGRLNANKDPLTALDAFRQLLNEGTEATLHLVYQDAPLLEPVKQYIRENSELERSVVLHGNMAHEMTRSFYSAADAYVSASYSEGGSLALVEAMACGCIPVVTRIPAALAVIDNGQAGLVFPPGESKALFHRLMDVTTGQHSLSRQAILSHFNRELSFPALGRKFIHSCSSLLSEEID